MTFSNDEELQKKWKFIVSVTCCVQRTYAFVKDLVNKMVEAINVFLRKACELLSEKFENISGIIRDTMDKYYKEPKRVVNKSYPHIYPPSVGKFKVNTKGYPNKILLCARSRC